MSPVTRAGSVPLIEIVASQRIREVREATNRPPAARRFPSRAALPRFRAG